MRSNAARALLAPAAVLALVAVVAVASRGRTSSGDDTTRGPSELVLATVVTFTLLLWLFGLAFLVYAFIHRKEMMGAYSPSKARRSGLVSLAIFLGIIALLAYLRSRDLLPGAGNEDRTPPGEPGGGGKDEEAGGRVYEPELAWIPLLVVVGLAAVASVALFLAARRRKQKPRVPSSVAATLVEALDDSLDDLYAETDPRRAVIAAYARLERVLAGHGRPRHSPETPEEFLARILPELDVEPGSIRRLADLYTWAKFSDHAVEPGMKDEAISALTSVRDELRAAEARRAEETRLAISAVQRSA